MAGDTTPMMRQYNEIKKDAPDSILFYRLGDFYEMFGDDAVEASEILDISLTTRNKNAENPIPMCGIPAKAYEKYLARLTTAGRKVAIADQVSDPTEPGIVQRKIVRIVTPGTTFSDHILQSKKKNFLAALHCEKTSSQEIFSVSFVEITTGDAFVQNFLDITDALQEIQKLEVAEVLLTPENFRTYADTFAYFSGTLSRHFMPEKPEKFLQKKFSTKTLKPFGIENNTAAISASALLFSFVEETQKAAIPHISGIFFKDNAVSMPMDSETIRNLELFASSDGDRKKSLFALMDHTKTSMGGRALQETFLSPLQTKEKIENRLQKVSHIIEDPNLAEILQTGLSQISDIERIIAKIATNRAIPRDFILLKNSLVAIKQITEQLQTTESQQWQEWKKIVEKFFV